MNSLALDKAVKYALLLGAMFLLLTSPKFWIATPDSGVYVGTAENIVSSLSYVFNGFPNILYYPGTSSLLAIGVSMFDDSFWALQLYFACITLASLWLVRTYFSKKEYGLVGVFAPLFLLVSLVYLVQIFALLSDGIFLTFSLACLLFWRKYESTNSRRYLIWCLVLAGLCSLIRFHGLFLCLGFSLALFMRVFSTHEAGRKPQYIEALILSGLVLAPFLIWTLRNYFQHSPDTFSMANSFFFGLEGLNIYAKGLPGNVSSDWISADWKFPFYRGILYLGGIAESWLGPLSIGTKVLIAPVIGALILLGIRSWYIRASTLEVCYVLFSVSFMMKDVLFNRTLYFLTRYWLPLLPFVIVTMGFGMRAVCRQEYLSLMRRPLQATIMVLLFCLFFYSSPNLTEHIRKEPYFSKVEDGLQALEMFSDNAIPIGSHVATTDWGVLPRSLKRKSFPVLNDPNHHETIGRMLKYNTEYLVIHEKNTRSGAPAIELTQTYPDVFTRIFSKEFDEEKLDIYVFRVDLPLLRLSAHAAQNTVAH